MVSIPGALTAVAKGLLVVGGLSGRSPGLMAGPCSIFFVLDALLSVTLRVSSGLLCTLQPETTLAS